MIKDFFWFDETPKHGFIAGMMCKRVSAQTAPQVGMFVRAESREYPSVIIYQILWISHTGNCVGVVPVDGDLILHPGMDHVSTLPRQFPQVTALGGTAVLYECSDKVALRRVLKDGYMAMDGYGDELGWMTLRNVYGIDTNTQKPKGVLRRAFDWLYNNFLMGYQ